MQNSENFTVFAPGFCVLAPKIFIFAPEIVKISPENGEKFTVFLGAKTRFSGAKTPSFRCNFYMFWVQK